MMATSVQLRYTMRSRSASDPVFEVGCKLIENSFPDVVSDEEGIIIPLKLEEVIECIDWWLTDKLDGIEAAKKGFTWEEEGIMTVDDPVDVGFWDDSAKCCTRYSRWGMSRASHRDWMWNPSRGSWGPIMAITPDEIWLHTVFRECQEFFEHDRLLTLLRSMKWVILRSVLNVE